MMANSAPASQQPPEPLPAPPVPQRMTPPPASTAQKPFSTPNATPAKSMPKKSPAATASPAPIASVTQAFGNVFGVFTGGPSVRNSPAPGTPGANGTPAKNRESTTSPAPVKTFGVFLVVYALMYAYIHGNSLILQLHVHTSRFSCVLVQAIPNGPNLTWPVLSNPVISICTAFGTISPSLSPKDSLDDDHPCPGMLLNICFSSVHMLQHAQTFYFLSVYVVKMPGMYMRITQRDFLA
jgi:hypothetical protein